MQGEIPENDGPPYWSYRGSMQFTIWLTWVNHNASKGAGLSVHFGESLKNYSSTPMLHQMLTRQGAAGMAQQCPHEQPEETMLEPITDTCSSLFGPDEYSCKLPQFGKKECMSTHHGNGQDSFDII